MDSLDISGKGICEFPQNLPDYNLLKSLHCEGNKLQALPESLFITYVNLTWLDLRNNRLTVLSSSIHRLRALKTLLLEGNQLITLPAQLSLLPHLTGLNISRNPLQDPPSHITGKGTKAVLSYLRDKLWTPEDDGEDGDVIRSDYRYHITSSDDSAAEDEEAVPAASQNSLCTGERLSQEVREQQQECSDQVKLEPSLGSAILHSSHAHFHHLSRVKFITPTTTTSLTTKKKQSKKVTTLKPLCTSTFTTTHHVMPLSCHVMPLPTSTITGTHHVMSKESRVEVNHAMDKIKSKQSLQEWREQAKLMQREKMKLQHIENPKVSNFRVMSSSVLPGVKTEDELHQPLTMLKDTLLEERARRKEKNRKGLEMRRKQAGIISSPTMGLEQAEDHLAEALAMQQEMEYREAREYRLRAFTGDLF